MKELVTLLGYTVNEKIHEGNKNIIYRGIRNQDNLPVILKLPAAEYPSSLEIEKLNYEYEIYRKFRSSGINKLYELGNYRNSPVLIMEDIGGESLKKIIKTGLLDLKQSLKIAVKLAEALGEIHQNHIIHKDINPNNIIFNLTTNELRIIDFGSSTLLSRENIREVTVTGLVGTLPYISPEQTGRMNRALDYRTDLYSLGVTFYEMFSGVLPFLSGEALELVYCHIAVDPIPLQRCKIGISETISKIVMKLMAKDAEKRYQSSMGLKSDLLKCLEQLERGNEIGAFELGENDRSDQFRIPQKLYGREQEIKALLESFGRVAEGSNELMLVAGLAGIGKSSLVHEIYKPVIENRGFFIAGKFDQYQRNIPYSALIYAFKGLIHQILSESEENIEIWRERILKAVGECGQIVIALIPEVELIIGQQPALSELDPAESQNRFHLILLLFVKVFCPEGQPLVIFMDDLQWADLSSLKMMEMLLTDKELRGILVIGAYRDQEVDSTHPLLLTVKAIDKTATRVTKLLLKPLELDCVNQLLEETCNCPSEQVRSLASLCVQKTGGNPYFLNQFLTTLYRDNFIRFNSVTGVWQWDFYEIEGAGVTDNIVDMMVGRIQKLPRHTQEMIRLAACIGNTFDLKTLSIISEKAPNTVTNDLWGALENELVLPFGDSYKYSGAIDNSEIIYQFTHDRVQQAAYSSIEESAKKEVHLKIGQLMLRNLPEQERGEKIFDIVNHFSIGLELINIKEYPGLNDIFLAAGEKAKATGAYELAYNYFRQGITLLEADSWERQYDLALKLHIEGMEAAYLSLDFEEMDILMALVLDHAKETLEKIKAYEIKIQALMSKNDMLEAVNTARFALSLLGVKFPKKAGMIRVILELGKIKLVLMGKKIEKMADLPLMTNPYKLAAMNIMSNMIVPLHSTNPIFAMVAGCNQLSLTIRYGIAPASSYAFAQFGMLNNVLGNIELGYQFGQLGLGIAEKNDFKKYKAKVFNIIYGVLKPWKEDTKKLFVPLLEAYQTGMENGDFEYAAHCARFYLVFLINSGVEISTWEKEMASFYSKISRLKQKTDLNMLEIIGQWVINISNPTNQSIFSLKDEANREDGKLPLQVYEKDQYARLYFYYYKMINCSLFEEYSDAINLSNILEKEYSYYLKGNTIMLCNFHFYSTIARLISIDDRNKLDQKKNLQKINSSIHKIKKWSQYNPGILLPKLKMMEAERARVYRKELKAMEYYDQAIELSVQNGNLLEIAFANELAAKFYSSRKKTRVATVYLKDAYYYYMRWGALNKVADLERRYPDLLSISADIGMKRSTTTSASSSTTETLDLTSILKATQAISGEIVLEKLLKKLIEIVLETAGAQKVVLIMRKEEQLAITAMGSMDDVKVTAENPVPIGQSTEIPLGIIHYVNRTKESVILDNAAVSERFSSDTYIANWRPKSVLCVPIINKSVLKGLLYLENNLLAGAFTGERIEILTILSSQVAVSIENANLYSNLDELVQKRTRELSDALENLKNTQNQLIESEKMAALGQLIAGIAHEINTPLGVIQSSITNITDSLQQTLDKLPLLFKLLSEGQQEIFLALLQRALDSGLAFSSREERAMKKNLIHELEKHQIVDPAPIADFLVDMGIYFNLEHFLPLLRHRDHLFIIQTAYQLSGLQRNSRNIKLAAERVAKMVIALRSYARYDHSGEMVRAEITDGVETVLTIYHNQIKHAIEVIRKYSPTPPIMCYPDELNQVWTNIIQNGLQAMEYKGKLEIEVYKEGAWVVVNITDNGKGIPKEIQEKIFEPFFTTKPQGEGTGLGLDIVKKIIGKHQGEINVTSVPGRTTFRIKLPIIS